MYLLKLFILSLVIVSAKATEIKTKEDQLLYAQIVKLGPSAQLDYLLSTNFYNTPETEGLNLDQNLSKVIFDFTKIAEKKNESHYQDWIKYIKNITKKDLKRSKETFHGEDLYSITPGYEADVKYLREIENALWYRYKMIAQAKKHIWISYYIWSNDRVGNGLLGLILYKLQQNPNLDVKMLVDDRGGFLNHYAEVKNKRALFKTLVKHGANIKIFNPLLGRRVERLSQKGPIKGMVSCNHDKIIYVDGKMAMLGGRNIGFEYFDPSVLSSKEEGFDDADVYLEFKKRPYMLEQSFLSDFNHPVSESITAAKNDSLVEYLEDESNLLLLRYPVEINVEQHLQTTFDAQDVNVKIIDKNSSLGKIQVLEKQLISLMDKAQTEILMQNPYVVFTKQMEDTLERAAKRGVKIVLQVPFYESNNSALVTAYIIRNYKRLIEKFPGIEIYAKRGPRHLHSKIFVIDQKYSIVGSFNLDRLSADFNSEIAPVIESLNFASIVRNDLIKSIQNNSVRLDETFDPSHYPDIIQYIKKVKRSNSLSKILEFIL